jgi:hypothetical protein
MKAFLREQSLCGSSTTATHGSRSFLYNVQPALTHQLEPLQALQQPITNRVASSSIVIGRLPLRGMATSVRYGRSPWVSQVG